MQPRNDQVTWRQALDSLRIAVLSRDEELVRLLLVIDADAGSEHADREAERLGLTSALEVARNRRNENMAADSVRSVLGA